MTSSKHDSEILAAIPSGVWAVAWATRQEEKGKSFGGGTNLIDVAPKPPKRAKDWAKKIADEIVRLNGASLEDLYDLACEKFEYSGDKEQFGCDLGMQSAGHGVSWEDDANYRLLQGNKEAIKLPYSEFYY